MWVGGFLGVRHRIAGTRSQTARLLLILDPPQERRGAQLRSAFAQLISLQDSSLRAAESGFGEQVTFVAQVLG